LVGRLKGGLKRKAVAEVKQPLKEGIVRIVDLEDRFNIEEGKYFRP
jgi:hypothetical protein